MEWYEPKEKTARIDWRCDTPYWNFKIINIDNTNFALYAIRKNIEDKLIRISKNMNELHYYAYNLNLMYEREANEFR